MFTQTLQGEREPPYCGSLDLFQASIPQETWFATVSRDSNKVPSWSGVSRIIIGFDGKTVWLTHTARSRYHQFGQTPTVHIGGGTGLPDTE